MRYKLTFEGMIPVYAVTEVVTNEDIDEYIKNIDPLELDWDVIEELNLVTETRILAKPLSEVTPREIENIELTDVEEVF